MPYRHPELPEGVIPAPLDLENVGGNAMDVVAAVSIGLREAGNDHQVIMDFRREALSGDYDHVLATALVYTTDPDD
jgi:hypothetical protein